MTTLSHFLISITSWLGKPRFYFWALGLLVLLSCNNELSEVGFKNPNRDFDVVAKEFIIPTKVFLMDSIPTSTGIIESSSSRGTFRMPAPQRVLVGSLDDPRFGKTTAVGYSPYALAGGVFVSDTAVYEGVELTVVFDYYWTGSENATAGQKFQVYELEDSVLTYLKHYSNQSASYGALLGEDTHDIDPKVFDQNIIDNATNITVNPNAIVRDSIHMNLDDTFGQRLFNAAMDTLGNNEENFGVFRKFRRNFKGFAFVAPNADKIIGLDIENQFTKMTLKYRNGTTHYKLLFYFSPPGQANGTSELIGWTQITTDRSGTPLDGLTQKYQDFEPADGNRYVQSGTGVGLKLDFSEVVEYFKNVSSKALSVAELKLSSDNLQRTSPLTLTLRALRADNRELKSSKIYQNLADNPEEDYDVDFVSKHLLVSATYARPYLRADVVGDEGTAFSLSKQASTTGTVYTGYLTSYLQQELSLTDTDFLRYYALFPQTPDNARGVDGLYFPAGNLKLTVYYTTPKIAN